ncbi:DUF6634 family protein [Devosia sp.]|uniref:DUF6634 family protein n=1 Tax=Devosia sp. TaxID=1871048 RepID=UPI002FCAD993
MSRLSRQTAVAGLRAARRLHEGERPTNADLAVAPLLEGWALEEVAPGLFRLVGVVTGHPLLADGWCSTSVLLFIDADRTWARTVSRLYRLGMPLAGEQVTPQ